MTATRRHFITLLPLAGAGMLAGCSDAPAPPAPAPAPAPSPAAVSAPEPAPAQASAPPADATTGSPAEPATGTTAAGGLLDEQEPIALALGYVAQASRADKARYPSYAAGQACSNCALFGGKAGEAAGSCPLFAGRQVAAEGWCSGYVKKTT